jgi:PHD/YefM family antitoxin component YafN of YafNO toxin-antitoxin module
MVAMKTIPATRARQTLYKLLDEVAVSSEPVQITGRRANAILVSEDDWRAIQETLYLISQPALAGSIREGMATPIEECVEELDW